MKDYQKINSFFLDSNTKIELEEIDFSDSKIQKYLFNNRLTYPFLKKLEKQNLLSKTSAEKLDKANQVNQRYLKSLYKVYQICQQNQIDFLLYKTHRFIDGVVDGDIDLIVKPEDFDKFLEVFAKQGFDCIEDEPRKGKCTKPGFLVIEPHIGVSWRGQQYLDQEFLWQDTVEISYQFQNQKFAVKNVSYQLEAVAIFYNVFFEPNYLDLRSLLNLKLFQTKTDFKKLPIQAPIKKYIISLVQDSSLKKSFFPIFAPVFLFLSQWSKAFFVDKKVSLKIYILHIIFYFYWRLRYSLIQVLPYTHSIY